MRLHGNEQLLDIVKEIRPAKWFGEEPVYSHLSKPFAVTCFLRFGNNNNIGMFQEAIPLYVFSYVKAIHYPGKDTFDLNWCGDGDDQGPININKWPGIAGLASFRVSSPRRRSLAKQSSCRITLREIISLPPQNFLMS